MILKKGLNRMPDNTGLNNMIGYKLMNKGDMEQAGKHFALNVASSPKVANAHDSYGDYLLKLGNKKEAKNSFLKAYEIGEMNPIKLELPTNNAVLVD